jgi:branched-chain amino acid transport system ATP-binding protein
MLKLLDVHTYYGESYVLQGICLEVKENSVVALLGRNGVGKTTAIRSIIGFTVPRRGAIHLKGIDVVGLPSYKIAQMGVGLVPQGRRIFPSLSVQENLTMSARNSGSTSAWSLDRIYALFPILKERAHQKGTLLSGGEQQMLTISRALMTSPELLLMDEPSEGLSPIMIQEVEHVIDQLKQNGLSILLVEQNLSMVLSVTDYAYIISRGAVVYESPSKELIHNQEVVTRYIGVGGQ